MAGRRFALSWLFVFGVLAFSTSAYATIFGNVRGIVHDPQHRPIKGAAVIIKAASTDWQQTLQTDSEGAFLFQVVPLGEYTIKVTGDGFAPQEQRAILNSGTMTDLHFQLSVATTSETVEVTDIAGVVNPQSSTSTTLTSRNDIAASPVANRTNSLQITTDFTP